MVYPAGYTWAGLTRETIEVSTRRAIYRCYK